MTTHDLVARGFVRNPRLISAYTYCDHCHTYQHHGWWTAPRYGVTAVSCEMCGTVPVQDVRAVQMYAVIELPVAVGVGD